MGTSPWLKNYAPKVRYRLQYPDISLHDLLRQAVVEFPDNTAVTFYEQSFSYGQLWKMSNSFASSLQQLGFGKGERLAIMLPNCPQAVAAYYGTLMAGGVVVQTNPMYVERELEYQLQDSGSKVIVVLDQLLPRVMNVLGETPLEHVIVVSLVPGSKGEAKAAVPFEEFIRRGVKKVRPVEIDAAGDLAVLQYTGGTTGVSKGVMLTHKNLVANTLQTAEYLASDGVRGEERILVVLPLFQVYGMTTGMNLAVALAGNQILLPKFDIEEVLNTIDRHQPTLFPGAPTMYVAFNNHPQVGRYNVKSIRSCISGSAPLPVEVAARFEELTGGNLVEGYGLSEAAPVVSCNPLYGLRKKGSIGQPMPDTLCRIVDVETGEREMPFGQVGEVVVKGPQVMAGYWNKPEDTKMTLRDGWLFTGDLGYMDEEGYIYLVDRKKDMIIAGGFNIYPREVEEVLYAHPAVREAVAAGLPDTYRGETVKAYVVLQQGYELSAEDLKAYCRENLAAFKVPRQIEFRDNLPKTAVGKVLRRALLEEEKKKLQQQA